MSYFDKKNHEKIIVAVRVEKKGTPPTIKDVVDNYVDKPNPFSTCPRQFTEAISYITYPGVKPYMYLINTRGQIFYANNGMPHDIYNDEYQTTRLRITTGVTRKFAVHRLVAYQFCNPPYNFQDMVVNHINGNKHCNFANNLEWITMASNNQHSMLMHIGDTKFINGRPIVDENFVNYLCRQFEKGKSNTEIMRELGMEINNANHTLLRDIRSGNTWKHVTYKYNFARSSKKHAYTSQEKEQIKTYMTQGKTDKEIFKIMQGREYVASTDRKDSSYRTIQTIRDSSWFKRYNYRLQKI